MRTELESSSGTDRAASVGGRSVSVKEPIATIRIEHVPGQQLVHGAVGGSAKEQLVLGSSWCLGTVDAIWDSWSEKSSAERPFHLWCSEFSHRAAGLANAKRFHHCRSPTKPEEDASGTGEDEF